VTTNVGSIFSGNAVTSGNSEGETAKKNPLVLTCFAAEMGEGESVQVPVTLSGKSANGYALCGDANYDSVSYFIGAEFSCEGEEISTITYSINEGAFGITQLKDDRLVTDYVEYRGPELNCPDIAFEDEELDEGQDPSESKYEKLFVSQYTVSYDRQSLDTSIIGIYGEKADESIFQSIFGDGASQEQEAEGSELVAGMEGFTYGASQEQEAESFTSLMDGVEITCTVNYADGTTDSRVIGIKGCVQEEDGNTMPGFAYELK
jgi:hypothetical protein